MLLQCVCLQEAYIADLDAKSGASLKLTVLNPNGRIWTMVAGGGASVIYSDTICDLGGAKELANYGEYSGAPSESQTFEYAKTILSLMTKEPHPSGKVLIIGGGIANFTNVAATFKVVHVCTHVLHVALSCTIVVLWVDWFCACIYEYTYSDIPVHSFGKAMLSTLVKYHLVTSHLCFHLF